jgi:hypothetical protein
MAYTFTLRAAAATLCLALACALPAQAAGVSGQGTWETTLKGRDINRNAVAADAASAVYLYDTTLGITWLRNANANGRMTWTNANTWAANLSTGAGANTIDGWRLPTMTDTGSPGCKFSHGGTDCGYNPATSTSEMASLFYDTLGNKSYRNTSGVPQAGWGLTNTGSFQNMRSEEYWLGTEYAPNSKGAWFFYFDYGYQNIWVKGSQYYALAVRPGDVLVSAVPESETYAMLLAGLGLLGAVTRRRKVKQA